ncbi:Sushi, von Willebrand factor type A, EGF and pentraxin domain-containing protein 1 [Bulinus truncatus]|nr:Sushi, von Willebrand factor type A, EGF and pentraxin domain-containing protein 1 [Bulinus truncatus]
MKYFYWTFITRAPGLGETFLFIAVVLLSGNSEASDACPTVTISNGAARSVTDRELSMVHYRCYKGFTRYGSIRSYCTSQGMWIPPHPTCIKNGCPSLLNTSISNGRIQVESKYKQTVTSITCDQGYIRQGPEKLLCDGDNWSGGLPQCVKVEIKKDTNLTCDFEDNHLCGWGHNTDQVARWTRWAGPTFSSGTGPDTDHTHGTPLGNGYKDSFLHPFTHFIHGFIKISDMADKRYRDNLLVIEGRL